MSVSHATPPVPTPAPSETPASAAHATQIPVGTPLSGRDVGSLAASVGVVLPAPDFAADAPTADSRAPRPDARPDTEPDRLDRTPRRAEGNEPREASRALGPARERHAARNPFASLSRPTREAAGTRLALPVDLSAEIDLPPEAQGRLLAWGEAMLGRGGSERTVLRLSEGALLTGDDAQENAARKEGLSKADARQVARELRAVAAKKERLRQNELRRMLQLARLGQDPQAFVQRVMREGYALGNERMRDYAERMREVNALRKAIRKEADRVRQAITANVGRESDAALKEPFSLKEVDDVRRLVVDAHYTVQDAEEAEADAREKFNANAARPPWDRADGLSRGERLNLERWAKDDDLIEGNLDEIRRLAGEVSVAEFDRYIYPLLVRLAVYDDEDEMLEILEALPPYLQLRAVAQKIGEAPREGRAVVGASVAVAGLGLTYGTPALLSRAAAAGLATGKGTASSLVGAGVVAGSVLAPLAVGAVLASVAYGVRGSRFKDWQGKSVREALTGDQSEHYESLRNEALDTLSGESEVDLHGVWFSRGADAALDAYEDAMLAPPAAGDEPGLLEAGGRKTANTVGELKDYEKYLEDQLNSVGEDAQLMNVELQNQLQRQQQLLQMMSNLSKAMHDAAMSIVRKLEG